MLYRSQVIGSHKGDVPIFQENLHSLSALVRHFNNYKVKYILPDAESCEEHDAI